MLPSPSASPSSRWVLCSRDQFQNLCPPVTTRVQRTLGGHRTQRGGQKGSSSIFPLLGPRFGSRVWLVLRICHMVLARPDTALCPRGAQSGPVTAEWRCALVGWG